MMPEATISPSPLWTSPSADPIDETFGDVVEPADVEEAHSFDVVLLGEPYDGAVIGRRGARDGPAAIRDELASVKTHHVEAGPVANVADLGDLAWPESVSLDDERAAAEVQALTEEV